MQAIHVILTPCSALQAMSVRQIIPDDFKTDLDREFDRQYKYSHYLRPDVIDVVEPDWFHMTRLRFNGVRAVSPLPKTKPVLWDGDLGNNFYKDFSDEFPDKPKGWMPLESDFEALPLHDSLNPAGCEDYCEENTPKRRVGHYLFSSKPIYK